MAHGVFYQFCLTPCARSRHPFVMPKRAVALALAFFAAIAALSVLALAAQSDDRAEAETTLAALEKDPHTKTLCADPIAKAAIRETEYADFFIGPLGTLPILLGASGPRNYRSVVARTNSVVRRRRKRQIVEEN